MEAERFRRDAEKAKKSLAHFVRCGWETLEPGTPLLWNWHLDAICEHLQAVSEGNIRRLLVNVPPGHMKSLIVSVFWPAWQWVQRPEWRGLFSSYAMELAIRDSVRCRDLLTSEWYRKSFEPEWSFKGDQNVKGYFENTCRGFRFSLSVGGRATGFRGDVVVVDDPLNAKEQASEVARKEAIFWWDKVMSSRLNDQRKGARVIIMQRLHEGDLSGHVIAKGGYDHLCLPSEFEPERLDGEKDRIPRVTSIGWSDPRKVKGELLFPTLFPAEVLAEAKTDLGTTDYAGQHQQRPAPAEGDLFKVAWFEQRYTQLPELREIWTAWDTALKAEQRNDESAGVTFGLGVDGQVYILWVAHGRWETPALEDKLVAHAQRMRELYGDRYKGDYVEDKVSGTTLMRYVRRSHPQLVLIPVAAETDKVSRANGVVPFCESLRVVFPDYAAFPALREGCTALLDQLTGFPNGNHDDLVDAFVHGLRRVIGQLGRRGVTVG